MNEAMQRRLLETFVTLADTLVADYDVVDLLQLLVDTCRDVLDTTAAGILLADENGELEVIASTSEASRLVEVMQLSAEEGPCIESFRSGRRVSVPDIADSKQEWWQFRGSALRQGFHSMDALPLRLRDTTIGTLNLMRESPGAAPEESVAAAQAFADVATIGILHERTVRESTVLTEQLQSALNSRIVIEQAKGVVSHTRGVSIDEAFTLIRGYARSHSTGLSLVAARIVNRTLHL
ncbi:GAF and ANTAR domain-containing protein [uncultured Microbacterium sp.]|uniref:GAF and ANTAR domain-containing protein n=1 Tax=uncultured Microbacterium sp. TaxID=191216 RepID=UPI0028D5A8F0|nr:GAF and ANTAR domain-containing protein [uncultured Microbacterium sp.]